MSIINFDNDVCALTDTGLVRPHNEDSNRIEHTPNGDLFVVCDGMGGHVGGATASRIGVESICQYVREHECNMPQQFLVKALEYANERIFAESRANPNLRGMGTTACVALVRDNKVWYAHVGDSRIYYFNSKKKGLYRLTKDHSVVQALVDQGVITEIEAEHHPEKNKIRKSLGIKADVEPEPCQMPLIPSKGDILLICSDGLSGMMDEEDILEVLSTTSEINEVGKVLVELAKSGGGTDNITVQIIRFSGIGERDAVFDAKNSGVLGDACKKKTPPKSLWPLITIAISCVLLIFAGALFFMEPAKETEKVVEDTATKVVVEDAYQKEEIVRNAKEHATFKYNGHTYLFYKKQKLSDGRVEGIRVRVDDKTYEVGVFEEKYISEKRINIYIPIPDMIKRYYRDGSPR